MAKSQEQLKQKLQKLKDRAKIMVKELALNELFESIATCEISRSKEDGTIKYYIFENYSYGILEVRLFDDSVTRSISVLLNSTPVYKETMGELEIYKEGNWLQFLIQQEAVLLKEIENSKKIDSEQRTIDLIENFSPLEGELASIGSPFEKKHYIDDREIEVK